MPNLFDKKFHIYTSENVLTKYLIDYYDRRCFVFIVLFTKKIRYLVGKIYENIEYAKPTTLCTMLTSRIV